MNVHTVSARLAAGLVATIAGAASWEHIASVAAGAGERPWVAYSLPAAIDGLILVGVAALLEDKRADRTGRLSARLAIVTGVVATLAANVASAAPTTTARLVAVAAPVAFLLSIEVLTRTGKPRISMPHGAEKTGRTATRDNALSATHSQDPTRGGVPATTKPRRKSTGDRVTAAAARMTDPTPAKLAAKLGVSERTVTRYWSPAVRIRTDASDAPQVGPAPVSGSVQPSPNGAVK